jgi:thiamine pyrophosphate-dependent acetolactate synthase large subunit-like protein
LRAFVDAFGLPVTTTLMGIGGYDTTEPLALHMLGMHGTAYANYAVEDCDFLLTLGARFDDRVASVPAQFAPHARFIAHIDIDPAEIDRSSRPTGITSARSIAPCSGWSSTAKTIACSCRWTTGMRTSARSSASTR